jgi:class 3 adenylate cyclase/tetratricopeptide (TPR) repeat protein
MITCASCGQENPDGFRFCGVCGADLSPPAVHEVRKTVTVVFCDLAGSTALGERLDPESLRRVMSRYFDEMQAVLVRHGGTVEKFIGDAVMAVFGIPTLHEDDALRALRAAAEMRQRLDDVNRELERNVGVRLEGRIGVNTGEVVAGDAESQQRLATGDAVNVAARLEQAAAPGEILLGERTLQLARAAIDVEPAGSLELKGKTGPLAAYRLVDVTAGAEAFERRFDVPLVGRRDELDRVYAAFERAVSERDCRLVTVLGPPGIGKSRLARELVADVSDRATVLVGQCLPYGEGITYWPLREIFAAAGAEDEFEAALAAATPEDTFWAVRKALERRARERPVALVVEDIHWAEPTLLDLLEHLVDWTRDAPLLLACLARPDLLDERPAWGAGRRNADAVTLTPLSENEADALIESLLDGSPVAAEARSRIRSVAEGNPLFVEQLLANLAEGADVDSVPPTLQALLAARVDGLPAAEREVLERAAVAGMEFEWQALAHLADGQRPAGSTLAGLVRKELIRADGARADWFTFRHALIRDAAYERIPKERRADLHERAARWLERKDAQVDALIGYHLEQAVRFRRELGGTADETEQLAGEAGRYLAAAARRADARFDLPAIRNLMERAIALLPEGAERADLHFRLAEALFLRGEMARAAALIEAGAAAAQASGDPALQWRARLELAFLDQQPHGAPLELAEEALRFFQRSSDAHGLLYGLSCVGNTRHQAASYGPAADAAQEALRLALDVGEWRQATSLIATMIESLILGPVPVRDAIARSEVELAVAQQIPSLEAPGHVFLGLLYALDGRIDEGRRLYEHGQEVGEMLQGVDWPIAWSRANVGARIELLGGNGAAAERELRTAMEVHAAMSDTSTLPEFQLGLAQALWLQGRDAEGTELALQVAQPDDNPWTPVARRLALARWHAVRARALSLTGAVDDAEREARAAIEAVAETDCLWAQADAGFALGDALRAAGRENDAAAAYRDALALYERKGHVTGAEHARAALAAHV